jgi:DNA polymerase sigma
MQQQMHQQMQQHMQQQRQQQMEQHKQQQQQPQQPQPQPQPRGGGGGIKSEDLRVATETLKKDMLTQEQITAISDAAMKVFGDLIPQDDEMQARRNICTRLERAVRIGWPGTRLVLFGSSGNNLCTKGSDLDLCLHVPFDVLHPNDAQYRNRSGASSSRDRDRQQRQRYKKDVDSFLLKLAVLLRNGGMKEVLRHDEHKMDASTPT